MRIYIIKGRPIRKPVTFMQIDNCKMSEAPKRVRSKYYSIYMTLFLCVIY